MYKNVDADQFNSFLDKALNSIACDAECQRNKTKQDLRNKFLAAQTNLNLAEPSYKIAKQNYYTYVSGESAYEQMIEAELNKQIDDNIKKFREELNIEITKMRSQLKNYEGLLVNIKNVKHLNKSYSSENTNLIKETKNKENDILTNDRKTYYEDQQNDKLNHYYYYILWTIYIACIICYLVYSFTTPSIVSFRTRIIFFVIFLVLPFISTWVLGKIIFLAHLLYSVIPKNVYK